MHPVLIGLLVFVVVGLLVTIIVYTIEETESFTNKSEYGFYYDTNTRRFKTLKDKQLAANILVEQCKKDGDVYTPEEIANLSDSFLLLILESETAEESSDLRKQMAMMVDPSYVNAYRMVLYAYRRNNSTFQNDGQRQVVYNVIVNYFTRTKTPTGTPISKWTDALLIRTFLTRQLPKTAEFLQ